MTLSHSQEICTPSAETCVYTCSAYIGITSLDDDNDDERERERGKKKERERERERESLKHRACFKPTAYEQSNIEHT